MTTNAELYEALKYRVDVDRHGTRMYYNSAGQLHREDGPAVVWCDGDLEWFHNGKRHRIGSPAVIWRSGSKEWWINGLLHRDVGPAVIWRSGSNEWWQNGQRHRIDGPAVEYADGGKEWWVDDVNYTEQEYYTQLKVLGFKT